MCTFGVDSERGSCSVGGFATADELQVHFTVLLDSGDCILIAAILIVIAGELDDVDADASKGVNHARLGTNIAGVGLAGKRGFIASVGEIKATEIGADFFGKVAGVSDLVKFSVHAARKGGDSGLGETK